MALTRIGVGGVRPAYGVIGAKVEALSTDGLYNLFAAFPTGSTVDLALYDAAASIAAGSLVSVTLDSTRCVEIGSTGLYYWNSGNITTPPKRRTEYIWQMTDTITTEEDVLIFDGIDSRCHAILCR